MAKNDGCTTSMNHSVLVHVLENDSDPEDGAVTLESVTDGTFGACVIFEETMIKYTPNTGYAGVDSCIYSISDGSGLISDATLTITVLPVATPLNVETGADNLGFIVFGATYQSPPFDLSGIKVITGPSNGMVEQHESETGTWIYTPNSGFEGSDTFEYEVCTIIEPHLCDKSTCSVTSVGIPKLVTLNEDMVIQEPPRAVSDTASTIMNIPVSANVLSNDADPNNDKLTIIPERLIDGINGTCSISGPNIEYTPEVGFVGVDACKYSISDGNGGTDTASFAVTVFPLALPGNETTDIDTSVAISIAESLKSPSIDPSGVNINLSPANGVVEVLNDGTLLYTPNLSFEGYDEFEYEICASNSPNLCSASNVTILVTGDFSEDGSNDVPGFAFTDTAPSEVDEFEFVASSSYMCDGIAESDVSSTRVLFKYDLILDNNEVLANIIDVIELKLQSRLENEVNCDSRRSLRQLLISNMVGVNTNPPDKESDRTCLSDNVPENGVCVVIEGGITVIGNVDIEEVKTIIKSQLPGIVSESTGYVISSINSENDTSDKKTGAQYEYIAIAGAFAAVLVGAALYVRKRTHEKEESTAQRAEEVEPWFKASTSSQACTITTADNTSLAFLTGDDTTPSKNSGSSVFREKHTSPELVPISPANSIFSIHSCMSKRDYAVEDTVDL